MQIAGASPYRASALPSLSARAVSSDPSSRTNPASAPLTQLPADPQAAATPGAKQFSRGDADATPQQQRREQQQIAELVDRDRDVRAHEQAHAAVGGSYAGAPSYTYSRGPDGKRYVTGGEVGIDVAAVPNDPHATLRKMEVVLRAALAPAEPSAQDLRVAAQAQAQMVQARAELADRPRDRAATAEESQGDAEAAGPAAAPRQALPAAADLDLYRRLGDVQAPPAQVDLRA
ncbi:hypothetical protein HP532_07360 [Pseudomonas sp. CrR25]|nr:hypothetical protein [Pseudomonas sp. CrR25]